MPEIPELLIETIQRTSVNSCSSCPKNTQNSNTLRPNPQEPTEESTATTSEHLTDPVPTTHNMIAETSPRSLRNSEHLAPRTPTTLKMVSQATLVHYLIRPYSKPPLELQKYPALQDLPEFPCRFLLNSENPNKTAVPIPLNSIPSSLSCQDS